MIPGDAGRRGVWVLIVVVLGAWTGPARAQTSAPMSIDDERPREAAFASRIELRASPLLSLHLLIRAVAAGRAEAPAIERFEEAAALARRISEEGGERAWALIDGGLAVCDNAEQARAWAAEVRLAGERPNARRAQPEMGATEYVEAVAGLEAEYLAKVWPGHEEVTSAAMDRLNASLLARQAECFADACGRLGVADPAVKVPVYLVASGPPPGGVTYRTRGGVICIVDVSAHPGTALEEAVLHEALHAVDAATAEEPGVLNQLREQLRGDGSRPSPGWRDVPHTVIFAQAAATVRAVLEPGHVDYGVTGGYYERVKPAAEAVRPAWAEYLAGAITREQAVERILSSYDVPEPPAE